MSKKGSLMIVGSGIASIAQLTLQAISAIENASKVFYVVADPICEAYIQTKNKNCTDLFPLYENGKLRHESYVQMAEIMLREVRAGENVVGVFYGHPGVFVSPTHRAIAIAREEGYQAKMLPGISAVDCLYADLGIDPARGGCLTYEASDFLGRDKPVNPYTHLILWQVGTIGVLDFNAKGFDNTYFGHLVDLLEKHYGKDHIAVHYMAPVMPTDEPIIANYPLSQLRDPEVQKTLTSASTLYLPAKEMKSIDYNKLAQLLRSPSKEHMQNRALETTEQYYPPQPFMTAATSTKPAYGDQENKAVSQIDNLVTPASYTPLIASDAMSKVQFSLSLDPNVLARYKNDPKGFAESIEGLTDDEKAALISGNSWKIRCAMRKMPDSFSVEEADSNQRNAMMARPDVCTIKCDCVVC